MAEEPTIFTTHSKVEAMLRKEGKASNASVYLDIKASYFVEVAAKPSPTGVPKFQKFDDYRGNTR